MPWTFLILNKFLLRVHSRNANVRSGSSLLLKNVKCFVTVYKNPLQKHTKLFFTAGIFFLHYCIQFSMIKWTQEKEREIHDFD